MLQFQYIYVLIGLAIVPLMVIIFLYARGKKLNAIKKIGDAPLIAQLLLPYKRSSYIQKFILFTIATTLLILAVANLRTPAGAQHVNRNGIDVMLAIDVSKSMMAQDVQPNRLERAKQFLYKIIDKLDNDRIGIVVFAGKAYMQMPLSADHASAKMYLSSASVETIPTQGTVIGDALKMSYAAFNNKEKKYKSIILVSDGEDHDEGAVGIAGDLAKQGVVIHTVGIGSPEGAQIVDNATGEVKKDADGNIVISKLNEDVLRKIAAASKGTYQLFSSSDAVAGNISEQLSTMDQRAIRDDSLMNFKSLFQYLVGLAFILLLIELLISERRRMNKSVNALLKPFSLLIVFSLSLNAFSQNEKQSINKGNELYKQKNYPAAAQQYQDALKKNPTNNIAYFNLGNAYYKGKKQEEAIAAYDKAIKGFSTPAEKSQAYYNKGVVLQNNNRLEECIEAYKASLRLNPNDDDARQNLQKALRKQQQQKDQQQNQQKNQQEKPKPQSKMNKQDAEDKLKALMQQEKNLQDKLHKVNMPSPEKPEKDW